MCSLPIFFFRGDFMAIIPGTTIEYEEKKHGEITSAYSYAKYVTGWTKHTLGDGSANQIIRWDYPYQHITVTAGDTTVYADLLWIYDEFNDYNQETVLIPVDANDTLPVITKLDLQKYKLVIDSFNTTVATSPGNAYFYNTRYPGYELAENELIYDVNYHWIDKDEEESPVDKIKPVLRYSVDGQTWYFYINALFDCYIRNIPNGGNKLDATNPYGAHMPHDTDYCLFHAPTSSTATYNFPGLGNIFNCGGSDGYKITFYNLDNSSNILHSMADSIDTMLRIIATLGVYFEYDDIMYLGFMDESGQTTGEYLTEDDWSKSAQFNSDNINNYTQHNPPYVPPPGPYDDDPWSGASFSGVSVGGIGAFARCYYMTSTELQNLRSWMGSINVPEGFDPMAQIIGLSQVPVALSGDAAENISFINSSAVYDPGVTTRVVDSGVASQYSMGLPKKYSLGSIDITRRMQERGEPYLDYSCQIELYLPLIGMFSLDTQTVMGRTIEAEAVLDPVSGTLAAYAWVSKDGQKLPIAYGSTTIGVDLPVTAQQYSVAKAALKQANAQLATSLLSSALTMVASASASGKAAASSNGRAAAASGMRNAREGFNSFTNAASIAASQTMVSQTGSVFGSFMDWGRSIRQLSYGNNTAISGSFGGSTAQWSYPFTAYVKIIRPRFEKPLNYAHTQGVPCVQAKKVGKCTGFIQCVGVDVSGITRATDIERQAIQAALSNGVYAGGGE